MNKFYTVTNRGYLHKKEGKPCQDYSLCYHDEEKTIIAVADGHGGKAYIRSNRGSRFACEAVLNVFKEITKKDLSSNN